MPEQEDVVIACDLTAIDAAGRDQHTLTAKQLFASVTEVQELADGFAFRLPAENITLRSAADFIHEPRHTAKCIVVAVRRQGELPNVVDTLNPTRAFTRRLNCWKQQCRHQQTTDGQEREDRCRLAYRRLRPGSAFLLFLGPCDAPMFQVVFFPESLRRSELRFFAMVGRAVLLIHHAPKDPDLFTAQETHHPVFGSILLARF